MIAIELLLDKIVKYTTPVSNIQGLTGSPEKQTNSGGFESCIKLPFKIKAH